MPFSSRKTKVASSEEQNQAGQPVTSHGTRAPAPTPPSTEMLLSAAARKSISVRSPSVDSARKPSVATDSTQTNATSAPVA